MFPYKSYTGKWLHVDLTTGEIESRECDPALAEDYVGGNGFGTRLLWERANPVYPAVSAHGTPGIVTLMDALGRFPTRNFLMGSFPAVDEIGAEALEARAFVRHLACFGCPVHCDKLCRIPDGPHARVVKIGQTAAHACSHFCSDLLWKAKTSRLFA